MVVGGEGGDLKLKLIEAYDFNQGEVADSSSEGDFSSIVYLE